MVLLVCTSAGIYKSFKLWTQWRWLCFWLPKECYHQEQEVSAHDIWCWVACQKVHDTCLHTNPPSPPLPKGACLYTNSPPPPLPPQRCMLTYACFFLSEKVHTRTDVFVLLGAFPISTPASLRRAWLRGLSQRRLLGLLLWFRRMAH